MLAVMEAKDNKHAVGAGMQQALEWCPGFPKSLLGNCFLPEFARSLLANPVSRKNPVSNQGFGKNLLESLVAEFAA